MLSEYIYRIGRRLSRAAYSEVDKGIWIANSASVSDSAKLTAPLIIGEECEIGRLTTLGKNVILGDECVIGNGSVVRSSVLFDGVYAAQNNYISDSIVGYKASFGMGAIVSVIPPERREIICTFGEQSVRCKRARLGAIVGDEATVGYSSVLSAGTVIERGARVNPLTRVRGFVSASRAYKGEKIIVSDILL